MLERSFQQPKFHVSCLGSLRLVEAGSGTDMTPTNRKTRALIGYLCIVGQPVGRERLASLLWGDRGEEQARASLRQAIYELRSLLGGDYLIRVDRDTVAVGEEVNTDVAEIAAAAQTGDLELLARVLSQWRADFFEDLPSIDPSFDEWLQAERVRVQDRLIGAAAASVHAGLARGEIEPARRIVNLLQQRDGTNEVVLRLGLRLDHRAGDSSALHRRYERFRELLKSELDAAPAAETQRLFQELTAKPSEPGLPPGPHSGGDDSDGLAQKIRRSDPGSAANPVPVSPAQTLVATSTETSLSRSTVRSWRGFRTAAAVLVLVALGALAWTIWNLPYRTAPSRREPLLVVLPFQNLGGDPGSRYVSDGITNEIAGVLHRTTQIGVATSPSSLRLHNARAAGAVAATHVLSGSVERVHGRIHVIAQLTDIQGDRVVWSHEYDGGTSLSPALRHGVAAQIAGAVGKVFASGSPGKPPAENSEAYSHYLKGRSLFLQRYPRAAAAELEAAIRLAPHFVNAWSALAAARWFIAADTLVEHRQAYDVSMTRAARSAAQRALALDPANGEAMGVLAMLIPATRLAEIDRQLHRALRFEPNNAQLLGWHGQFLMFVGRNHEALNELTRAYVLEPATPLVMPDLALAALKTGRYEQGREIIDLIDRGRDDRLRSTFFDLHMKYFLYRHDWLGLATWLGALPDRISPRKAAFLRLCRDTAIAFVTRDADRLDPIRARWRAEPVVDSDDAVQFLAALGDADGALQVVQSAVRSARNGELLTDPKWDALFVPDLIVVRRDPRIPVLLAQWGLSDYWHAANHPPDFMR